MKTILCFLAVASVVLTGCGDHSSKPGQSTNEVSGGVLSAPGDYGAALVKAQQFAVKTVDTASLKQAIQMFQADQGTLPQNLNELVQKKYLPKLPEAPTGMRLDYNPATGNVRVVKQSLRFPGIRRCKKGGAFSKIEQALASGLRKDFALTAHPRGI